MANLNKVMLIGNLTRDPEMRYSPSGTAIAKIGLAVNTEYRSGSGGDKKEDVCYINVTAFGKLAEIATEYLEKGRSILVEGRLSYRSWEDKDGAKRSMHEVIADQIQFLGQKPEASANGARAQAPKPQPALDVKFAPKRGPEQDIPF